MLQACPHQLETRRRPRLDVPLTSPRRGADGRDRRRLRRSRRMRWAPDRRSAARAAATPELLTPAPAPRAPTAMPATPSTAIPAGRFTLLSIVWMPGQFSPPHAHQTWCAYAVGENTLTETLLRLRSRQQKCRRVPANGVAGLCLFRARPGLTKSIGLVMPGCCPRSRSMSMASRAGASERMSTG